MLMIWGGRRKKTQKTHHKKYLILEKFEILYFQLSIGTISYHFFLKSNLR